MNRLTRHCAAYTVRELIAAICVIVLVIMLLPLWMNDGTRPRHQSTCSNNLKNLALAVVFYESSRNRYPGYREDIDRAPAVSPNDDRSWIFVILPQLDNRALYDQYRLTETPNEDIDVRLDLCICPNVSLASLGPAANCYVANTGLLDGVPDNTRPADFAANGIFHNRAAQSSPDIPIVTVRSSYVSSSDGTSTTLLLAENVDAGRWSGGPQSGSAGGAPAERWMGFTWHETDGQPWKISQGLPLAPLGINVRTGDSHGTNPQNGARGFARPSSHHPDIVLMAYCDGRVRKVSQDISYRVYQALMTPRGSEAMYASNAQPLPADHAARQVVTEEDIQ